MAVEPPSSNGLRIIWEKGVPKVVDAKFVYFRMPMYEPVHVEPEPKIVWENGVPKIVGINVNRIKAEIDKAAADKKVAEDKAVADKKAAEEKAEADKKAAEDKAAADKKASDEITAITSAESPDTLKASRVRASNCMGLW